MLGSLERSQPAPEMPSERAGGPGAVCFQLVAAGSGIRTGPGKRGSEIEYGTHRRRRTGRPICFFARPEEPSQSDGRRFARQQEAVPGAGDRSID
jgi:hypothetical protein